MVKKYRNQDYSSIKSYCQKSGRLFGDAEFPAADSSLYFSKDPPFKVEWKRPKEIISNAQMFVEGVDSSDVTQGRVGNCWFVAAAASLALEKSLWTKVIPDHKNQTFTPIKPEDYQGIFRFQFWRFGEWIEVVIDDRLPTVNNDLVYIKSKAKNEFWSALLEKAYAKLAGSYEALEAGNPADALVDFTGGVGETIDLVKGEFVNNLEERKALHEKMSKLMSRNALCSASIKVKNRQEMEQQLDTGLVKGHAYGISSVRTVKLGDNFFSRFNAQKLYLVKLRNPWGEKEWNGAWSDNSREWETLSKTERDKLDIKVENDGEFWMSFEDFCRHFTTITICELVNTSFLSIHKTFHEGAMKGRWVLGSRAGGCANNKESFLLNPQFRFDIPGNKHDVAFISLMQPDTRELKAAGKSNVTIGFHVMKVEGNRIFRVHKMYEKAGDSRFTNAREIFVRLNLPPGRFVLIPSTYDPDQEGEFLLRVYTDSSNNLRELIEDYPSPGCFGFLCKQPTCQLSCTVTTVNNLKKSTETYCIIEVEGGKVKTPVQNESYNPTFDYGGVYYVKDVNKAVLKIQVWQYHKLIPDTFLGEMERAIEINDKTLLYTTQLMERKNRDGIINKADGTVSFKLTGSRDLGFM